ncbi:MAG: hypothetical protein IPN94_08820 [Sphingobacteriales bacterium]|nr:hypothetical protein [Sphingobacteriales bacterium]
MLLMAGHYTYIKRCIAKKKTVADLDNYFKEDLAKYGEDAYRSYLPQTDGARGTEPSF